jgi:hypothetical protein
MHKRSRYAFSHVFRHLLILMMATGFALTAWVNLEEPQPVGASHFRAMQLNWEKTGPRQATFTAILSARWSYSSYGSPAVGAMITESPIYFGDGNQSADSQFQVTFVDQTNDFLIAEKVVIRDYSTDGPFTAYIDSCCRLGATGGHVNNPDDSVRITTVVNFAVNTADLGSPESGLAPIIDCPRVASPGSSSCSFVVTANDPSPSGYRLQWRMANISEMGSGVTTQPSGPFGGATVNASNGLYTWNTTDATLATCGGCNYTYYSTQVIVEKWYESGTAGVPGDDVLVSHVAIDFFVRFNNNPANDPPVFTSGPNDGDTLTWQPGVANNFTFTANDPNTNDTVTPSVIGLPPGASFTPTPGNPASGTLNWPNPISGTYQVVLRAQDQLGLGATPRTITIVVPALSPSNLTVTGTGTYHGTGTLAATLTGTGEVVELTLAGVPACNSAAPYSAPCPTTDANGVATLNNVPMGNLNAGAQPIGATFTGNTNYLGSSATGTLTLAKATPNLAVDPASGVYGGTTTLTATLTDSAGPVAGQPVIFFLNGQQVCGLGGGQPACPTTNGSGVATLSGASLAGINAGTYTPGPNSGVTASFAGDSNYNPISDSDTLTVSKANQTITFPNPGPHTYGSGPITLAATSDSGLPITYSVSGPCALVNGGPQVAFTGAGTCTVTASQPGNPNFNPAAPVLQSFTMIKADTGTTADDKTIVYGTTSVVLTAQTANISNGASLTGGTVTFTVRDSGNQTLCTTTPVAVSGGTSVPASATCTFTSAPNAGSYTVEATYSGDSFFNGSSDTATLTVTKANQTIAFPDPADATYGDGPITLAAVATSSLPITYTASGPCQIINGNQVQITGAGTCTVTADQPGNGNYNAAPQVSQSFAIARKALTVRVNNQSIQFGQTPACVLASGYPQGFVNGDNLDDLGGALACTTTPSPIVNVGSFPLTPSGYTSANYAISYVNASVTVAQCQGTLELTMLPVGPIQYSDQGTFRARFTNCGGALYPSGSVQFTIDNSIIGADTFDDQGIAEITVQVMQNIGNRTVMARFTSTDTRFASANSAPATLTLNAENATAEYTGKTSFAVNNATRRGTVQLSATIKDITAVPGHANHDAHAGDVRTAKVRFVYATGPQAGQVVNAACNNLAVSLVNYSDTKVGTASCSFPSAAATFAIRVEVLGNYAGTSAQTVTVVVGNGGNGAAIPGTTLGGQSVARRDDA